MSDSIDIMSNNIDTMSTMSDSIDTSNRADKAAANDNNDNNDNALVKVIYNEEDSNERLTVLGRDLHKALDIQTPYHKWFPRMCEYGFRQDNDYMILVGQKCPTNNPKNPWTEITDHQLTIDMAKEICMIQRTEIGKRCREYFLEIERQWNSPDAVMARALQMANRRMDMLHQQTLRLTDESRFSELKLI